MPDNRRPILDSLSQPNEARSSDAPSTTSSLRLAASNPSKVVKMTPKPSLKFNDSLTASLDAWTPQQLEEYIRKVRHLHRTQPMHAAVLGLVVDSLICEHWVAEIHTKSNGR
jgi:hypothetical protein